MFAVKMSVRQREKPPLGEVGHPPFCHGWFVVLLILSVLVHRELKCLYKESKNN